MRCLTHCIGLSFSPLATERRGSPPKASATSTLPALAGLYLFAQQKAPVVNARQRVKQQVLRYPRMPIHLRRCVSLKETSYLEIETLRAVPSLDGKSLLRLIE